jgi:CHAT domain-containing protein
MSRLVLASETPENGRFPSIVGYELLDARWGRLRLAFLSACSTAGGSQSASAGWFGFATPLLAAGISTVIVTLWDVSDRETQAFATAFYRYLQAGVPPATALQRTQTQMMRTQGHSAAPATWAAFVLVGAGDRPLFPAREESKR